MNIMNPYSYYVLVTKKCDPDKYYKFVYDPKFWTDNISNFEISNIQNLIESNKDHLI